MAYKPALMSKRYTRKHRCGLEYSGDIFLKVGVFHPPFRPKYFGGSVVVTVSVINALAEAGHDVILFASDSVDQKKIIELLGTRISPLAKEIVKTSFLPPRSLVDVYASAFRLLTLKKKCHVCIDTYSNYVFPWTDVCYLHFPYINSFLFRQHFPYLKNSRGCWREAFNLPYIFFEKNLESYSQKLILANSRYTASAIQESLGAKAEVLYPPVSRAFFQEDSQIPNGHSRENLVTSIGRITRDKRMETIPYIAKAVKEKNVRFVIMGFGHDDTTLRIINAKMKEFNLERKITILKDASRKGILDLLRKTKVYLHPPTLEHFGISIAEAMALGCIPVVYDDGGAKEFVPKEFRYENLDDAAEKVEKAINSWSPKQARRMNSIAERFAEPNFHRNFIKIFSAYCSQKK